MKALAVEFVPVADEVWRLQTYDDPDCRHFRSIADGRGVRRSRRQGTRQGIYVCAPSGRKLAFRNTLDANTVVRLLRQGLERWHRLPESERWMPDGMKLAPRHRWEQSRPGDGLVLTIVNRDLASHDPDAPKTDRWNRDHAWFTAKEARTWLPDKVTKGARHRLPTPLAERLARCHLVDNVRGQTLPFASAEIERAAIEVAVERIQGDACHVTIEGETSARARGPWLLGKNDWTPEKPWPRRLRTRLRGRATYDLEAGSFTDFLVVAIGDFEGRTQHNGRKGRTRGAIGFAMTLTGSGPAAQVAPTFLEFYDAAWVKLRPR